MKEKQIEEMASIIHDVAEAHHIIWCTELAKILYNAGYRKQKEGEDTNVPTKWISVEEAPKTYRDEYGELIPFLVCCKGTVYLFRAVYDGKNWGDGISKLNITHWMPLPDAPKGDEGK